MPTWERSWSASSASRGRWPASCWTTTNGSTAAATRAAWALPTSTSRRASSRCATSSTPCSRSGSIATPGRSTTLSSCSRRSRARSSTRPASPRSAASSSASGSSRPAAPPEPETASLRQSPSESPHNLGHVIAKVEPLTPARSLRGPFDYRLAGALEDVGVGSMLVVPFGRRRLLGVVVDVADESELPPERLAEPIAALEADVPQSLVALGLWVAREYVSTPARGLALVLPPGTGTGAGRPLRPKRSLRAAITPAGEAALREGIRMGAKQRAALEALAGGD